MSGDRARAGFFALIAALPGLVAAVGLLYLAVGAILEQSAQDRAGALVLLPVLGVFSILFLIVARWSYDAVHAALTPQRLQAMWLRRFQSEGGRAFRASRVIDRLSRYGISALTLQDRDVQLSWEQRRNRLAPIFWLLFAPVVVFLVYQGFQSWEEMQRNILDMPQAQSFQEAMGQFIGAFIMLLVGIALLFVVIFGAILLSLIVVMLVALISGPLGALLSRNRDDYKRLPRLLRRIEAGRRRGASVVRIGDGNWRQAVRDSLKAVDIAIIDLTSVSEHIAWEIEEAAKTCKADGLVFVCKADPYGARALSLDAVAIVRAALGRDPGAVVYYPATRAHEAREAKAFARDLREAIYDAADRKMIG